MHTGHQCKVNDLEYGELLLEICSSVNSESAIHRYIFGSKLPVHYITVCAIGWLGSHGYKYKERNIWKNLLYCLTHQKSYQHLESLSILYWSDQMNHILFVKCYTLNIFCSFTCFHCSKRQADSFKPDELSDHHTLVYNFFKTLIWVNTFYHNTI